MGRRSETAQILIQIRGAVKAVAETVKVTRSQKQLGDSVDESGRAALRAAAAMEMLERHLKQLTRAGAAAAAAASLQTLALRGLIVVALGLAITAMPLVVSALGAATLATVAFAGALVGLSAGIGLMAAGAVMRFKATSDAAGSAASEMKAAAGELKSVFATATADGSDKIFTGITGGLKDLGPLVRSLQPQFTAIGGAIGDTIGAFVRDLRGMGPELRSMLGQLPDAIGPLGQILSNVLGLVVRLADIAMPMLIDGLTWAADQVARFSNELTAGDLENALGTIKSLFGGIGEVVGGIADTLGPVLGPAVTDMVNALAGSGADIGAVIGLIGAGFVHLSSGALPGIVDAIKSIKPALQSIIDSGALETIGQALGDSIAWAADKIADLVGWLEKTGRLKPAIVGLAAAFVAVKVAIISVRVATVAANAALIAWRATATTIGVATAMWRTTTSAVYGLTAAMGILRVVYIAQTGVTNASSAAILRHVAASKIAAVTTRAQAVAQGVLNAVMSANPVLLVVLAIAALTAGFVLAYHKIGWFRNAVDGAWGMLKSVGAWIADHWRLVLISLTGPIGAAVVLIVDNFSRIKTAASAVVGWIRDRFNGMVSFFGGLPARVGSAFSGMWSGLKSGAVSAINWVIDKLNGLIDAYNGVSGIAKVVGVDLTIGKIGHVAGAAPAPGDAEFVGPVRRAFGGADLRGRPLHRPRAGDADAR